MRYLIVVVGEDIRDKRVVILRTRDIAVEPTGHFLD